MIQLKVPNYFFLSAVIVVASVGCVIGVRGLNYRSRPEHYFIGEIIVTIARVFPEYLIGSSHVPSSCRVGYTYHSGEPYIAVGATLGSAAANILVIGILNFVWPGRAGLESVGSGRPLASAAVVLLVSCVAVPVGLGVGRGVGIESGPELLIGGFVVFAVFLVGLGMVYQQNPKERTSDSDLDGLFQSGHGTLVGALGLAGGSAIALVYASQPFVELGTPWFRTGEGWPSLLHAAAPWVA